MVIAVVILILLTVAASLATWQFGQWLAGRTRVSSTALAIGGPLVAPIFTIPDVAGTRRQIRYAACVVTAPLVLRLLSESGGDEMAQKRLVAALRDDACYARVTRWSRGDQSLTNAFTGNSQ